MLIIVRSDCGRAAALEKDMLNLMVTPSLLSDESVLIRQLYSGLSSASLSQVSATQIDAGILMGYFGSGLSFSFFPNTKPSTQSIRLSKFDPLSSSTRLQTIIHLRFSIFLYPMLVWGEVINRLSISGNLIFFF